MNLSHTTNNYPSHDVLRLYLCKLSCAPKLWNARETRLNGKSRKAVATNGKLKRLLLSVQSAYRVLYERGYRIYGNSLIKEHFPRLYAESKKSNPCHRQRGL